MTAKKPQTAGAAKAATSAESQADPAKVEAAPKAAVKTDPPAPTITVTAKRPGFRRAGRAWPGEPTTVPLSALTADQIAALRAEPMLVVQDD